MSNLYYYKYYPLKLMIINGYIQMTLVFILSTIRKNPYYESIYLQFNTLFSYIVSIILINDSFIKH